MKKDDSWSANWSCERLISHTEISSAHATGTNSIVLTLKNTREPVHVASMSLDEVTASELSRVYTSPDIEFIFNIRKSGIFREDAYEMSELLDFGIGGLGDLYIAAAEGEFRQYVSKDLRFVLRGLRQHSAVSIVKRINNRLIKVGRYGKQDKLILDLNEYDVTAEAVREGIEKFGKPDFVLASNPNCKLSDESIATAKSCGLDILKYGELLGVLNH